MFTVVQFSYSIGSGYVYIIPWFHCFNRFSNRFSVIIIMIDNTFFVDNQPKGSNKGYVQYASWKSSKRTCADVDKIVANKASVQANGKHCFRHCTDCILVS